MLGLLCVIALSQSAPSTAPMGVVVNSRRPGTDTLAPAIALKVYAALERAGVDGLMPMRATAQALKGKGDARLCNAAAACVAKLAAVLGPSAVLVGVDVGRIGKALVVTVEAVSADKAESLAVADVSTSADTYAAELDTLLAPFAKELREAWKAKRAPPKGVVTAVRDAPLVTALAPTVTSTTTVTQAPTAPRAPQVLPWVFIGASVVAAGVAAGVGASALSDAAAYDGSIVTLNGVRQANASDATLQALANSTNTKASVALTSGLIALGFAAAAGTLFVVGR